MTDTYVSECAEEKLYIIRKGDQYWRCPENSYPGWVKYQRLATRFTRAQEEKVFNRIPAQDVSLCEIRRLKTKSPKITSWRKQNGSHVNFNAKLTPFLIGKVSVGDLLTVNGMKAEVLSVFGDAAVLQVEENMWRDP